MVKVKFKVKVLGESSILSEMHLDSRVSPSVSILTFRLTLTHVTFDLDPCDL